MVRSFNLSNYKNSIWRGREYAHLRYKKTETIPVEGTVVWWWQILNFFSDFSPSTIYANQSSFSIILFLGSPFFLQRRSVLGFYVFLFFFIFFILYNKRVWVFLRLSQNDAPHGIFNKKLYTWKCVFQMQRNFKELTLHVSNFKGVIFANVSTPR